MYRHNGDTYPSEIDVLGLHKLVIAASYLISGWLRLQRTALVVDVLDESHHALAVFVLELSYLISLAEFFDTAWNERLNLFDNSLGKGVLALLFGEHGQVKEEVFVLVGLRQLKVLVN